MKPWYTSKTLWLNLIAFAAFGVQSVNADFVISPDIQAGLLALINLILRAVTHQPLDWAATHASGEQPPGPPATAGFVQIPLALMLTSLLLIGLLANMSGCATSPPPVSGGAGGGTISATTKDTPMQLAGKSLLAVKSTIVTAATATDALCRAGQIAADKCSQAKAAYDLSKPAYDSAVNTYLLMSQGYADPAAFAAALALVQAIADNMLLLAGSTGGAK